MATPHPGYFFNLTDEGREFAEGLIHYGFFEVNENSLKTYFDPFALYLTPKEAYDDPSLVGQVSSTNASGLDYWNSVVTAEKKAFIGANSFDLSTPREIVQKEDRRLINRIQRKNVQGELDAMFEEQNIGSGIINTNSSTK